MTPKVQTVQGERVLLKLGICTDDPCFFKGGSSSLLLHKLVLRLCKVKLEQGFLLHMVHVAGTQMIAQGTDGLPRGIYLEGVMARDNMLSFINLAKSALEQQTRLLEYVKSWAEEVLGRVKVLTPADWFD
jgi:hypothetical protein